MDHHPKSKTMKMNKFTSEPVPDKISVTNQIMIISIFDADKTFDVLKVF